MPYLAIRSQESNHDPQEHLDYIDVKKKISESLAKREKRQQAIYDN